MPQTQSNYITTMIANSNAPGGVRSLGTFTTFSGGGVTGETVPDRAPGQEFPTQSGGDKTLEPITLGRAVPDVGDPDSDERYIASLVNITNAVTIKRQVLRNRLPFGEGVTWIATITGTSPTDSDNNSTSERTNFTVTAAPSDRH